MMIIISQVSNVFAISLIDKPIDYTTYQGQKVSETISIDNLKSNNNLLIKNSFDQKEIHLFDKHTNEYIYSYLIRKDNVYNLYLSDFSNEKEEYQTSGIEQFPTLHVSNAQNHNWYIDQKDTGIHAGDNCGPSSTAMALNWFNGNTNESAKQARSKIRSSGGWWYTDDIERYLYDKNISSSTKHISNEDSLIKIIDNGNIAILCINADNLSYTGNSTSRVGRFYKNVTGHFIVLTGYMKVGDKTYFEVYDPNSWGETSDNNILKGKGRYLESSDLLKAMNVWWNYAIEVKSKELSPEQINDLNILPISGVFEDKVTGKYGIHTWYESKSIDLKRFQKVVGY